MAIYQCAMCNRNYQLRELCGAPGRTHYYYCSAPLDKRGPSCHGNFRMYDQRGRLCAIQVDTGQIEIIDKQNGRLRLIGSVYIDHLRPFGKTGIPFIVWR